MSHGQYVKSDRGQEPGHRRRGGHRAGDGILGYVGADQVEHVLGEREVTAQYQVRGIDQDERASLRLNVALHKTDTDDLQTISWQGAGFALDNAGTAETYWNGALSSWAVALVKRGLKVEMVERLRPVELGPFDYENEVLTRSLWICGIFQMVSILLFAVQAQVGHSTAMLALTISGMVMNGPTPIMSIMLRAVAEESVRPRTRALFLPPGWEARLYGRPGGRYTRVLATLRRAARN